MSGKRRGRGEGGIEELPSGKFRAVLSAGKGGTGQRKRLAHTFATKRAALTWLRDRLSERDRGHLADPGRRSVSDWLNEWLAYKATRVETSTLAFYKNEVDGRLIPTLGHIFLSELSPLAIERAHVAWTKDGVSANTQRNAATTLRTALQDAVKLRVLASNPAKAVAKPKVRRAEVQTLDRDQARQFLAAIAGTRYAAYYELAFDSGARPGELLALHWPEVDFTAGTIFIRQSLEELGGTYKLKDPKTAAGRRTVRITPHTVTALHEHRRVMQAEGKDVTAGPVFLNRRGGWLSQPTLYRRSFLPALERAKLPRVRPYAARHTSATLLLQAGVSIKVVSQRLGHENIETTLKHYVHAMPDHQEKAVEVISSLFGDVCPTVAPRATSEAVTH